MGAAVLTEVQENVLSAVRRARPHAVPSELARILGMAPAGVMKALDALTRRGFVTPVALGRSDVVVYVATKKARARR